MTSITFRSTRGRLSTIESILIFRSCEARRFEEGTVGDEEEVNQVRVNDFSHEEQICMAIFFDEKKPFLAANNHVCKLYFQ
jgi:hypothetical protein